MGLARSLKEEVPCAKWAWKQPFWASHGHIVMGPVGGDTKTIWRSSEKDERLYTWQLLL